MPRLRSGLVSATAAGRGEGFLDKEPSARMSKIIISLSVAVIAFAGYSWSWSKTEVARPAVSAAASQEAATAAELRYKHAQPAHWRALFLRQQ